MTQSPAAAGTGEDLEALCVARLRDAFNPETALFDRQLRRGSWGPTLGTESITSTAISLIGLVRAGIDPAGIVPDLEETRDALCATARRRRYAGGLGLVLWANGVTGGPPSAEILGRLGLSLGDIPALTGPWQTMEVAWLLSGLAHELARSPGRATREAFVAARSALLGRFERAGRTFRHADEHAPPLRRARRWVANFADQIYPIQALALASSLDDDGRSLEVAAESAGHMVELQGPLGQWWWHYDARDGKVAQAYPVYSVHQHGMAPMALRSLAAAGGPDHGRAVDLGRRWLVENELGVSLIDPAAGTIWRDIERAEGFVARQSRRLRSVLGRKEGAPDGRPRLAINRETRPYEWGWFLFAAALDRGPGGGAPRLS